MNKELLKGHSELIILSALAKKPMHGYVLSEALREAMPDMFQFGVGMLYPLLHKLERKRLITGQWLEVGHARRKVYSLTKNGKKQLASQSKEWRAFNQAINQLMSRSS
ncbi:MAG: helix-turn-helix transcriptional regulator [Patescibacteria group bacterium]|jgi:DNA-binding PadR family transcriptional regulator